MRRPRVTIGRLMIGVAIAAACLAWRGRKATERRQQFEGRAAVHDVDTAAGDPPGYPVGYHARMKTRYEWAARYSWLPVVWSDPWWVE